MRAKIEHLKRTLWHKWFVFIECWRLGIPWLGLIHDWDKFIPSYFVAFACNHYNSDGSKRPRKDGEALEYKYAFLRHLNHNKHHPEYWMLRSEPLPIPKRYREEMLCDWKAFSRTDPELNTRERYLKLKDTIVLHTETREWIEAELGL